MSRTPNTPSPSPSGLSTGSDRPRRRLPLWPLLALLVGIASCGQGGEASNLEADTPTESVRIYLIEREESGDRLGRKTSCGDNAVPVEMKLPRRMPALGGALETLLGMKGEAEDSRTGLYNALHASPLRISNIQRRGGELRVRLEGYLELGEACDGERALSQLTETALQFSDIQAVFFYLGDKPLREALTGK